MKIFFQYFAILVKNISTSYKLSHWTLGLMKNYLKNSSQVTGVLANPKTVKKLSLIIKKNL